MGEGIGQSMMVRRYILDGRTPVPCDDEAQWSRWFAANFNSRHVAVTETKTASVSTVFLGIAIERGELPPQVFETIIFGGPHDGHGRRCATWAEAEAQHAAAVALAGASVN